MPRVALALLLAALVLPLPAVCLWARWGLSPRGLDRSTAGRIRLLAQGSICAVAFVSAVEFSGRLVDGAVILVGMASGVSLFSSRRYPFRLTRTARVAFPLLAPLTGVIVAAVLAVAADPAFVWACLGPAITSAWLVTLLAGYLQRWLLETYPVKIVIVGSGSLAEAFAEDLLAGGIRDHAVVGFIAGSPPFEGHIPVGTHIPCLGSHADLPRVLGVQSVDLLVVGPDAGSAVAHELKAASTPSVRALSVSAAYEEMYGRVALGAVDPAWAFRSTEGRVASLAKRMGDVVGAGLLLFATLPFTFLAALLVKAQDGGPALYRQRRVGRAGVEFTIFKFRSMAVNAEREDGPAWSRAGDPRVTVVGRLLRRTHLDELPQLYNVLRGEMSLVGPRPERAAFVQGFAASMPYYDERHSVKPGLTGWAQVRAGYGGSAVGTAGKLSYDLYYVKHQSFLFDFLILVETCRMLVAKTQFEVADSTVVASSDASLKSELRPLGLMSPLLFPAGIMHEAHMGVGERVERERSWESAATSAGQRELDRSAMQTV